MNVQTYPQSTQNASGTNGDLTTDVVLAPDLGVSQATSSADASAAIPGETPVWEARYSFRNFLVRAIVAGLLTVGWAAVAWYNMGPEESAHPFIAATLGIAALILWVLLGFRVFRARYSHHYRLTTRRLFVSNGFFLRRVDQIELLRIKDLFLQQSMLNRWLDVGTVVVISSEVTLPKAAVFGIERPHLVMDLIWKHTRLEQDRKATKVEQI